MAAKSVIISVRNIVEFVLKSGDIDSRYMSASRMQEGVRIHQKIQKQRKKDAAKNGYIYESEVSLRDSFIYKDFAFTIEGRADGMIIKDGEIIVEEIKSTYRELDAMECDESHWHWAQAKFYAYIYCLQNKLEKIIIYLNYCHVETMEQKIFDQEFSFDALKKFYYDIVESYFAWVEMDFQRKFVRDASIKASGFPYEGYRKGQREFAVLAYRAIQSNKNLFIEAPTGTGKTISALFPAVKALGEDIADKIFYLTAKTITRQAAENAVFLMKEKGFSLSCITLTAKDKICMLEERNCSPAVCPFARGHFDRVNGAVWDIVTGERSINRKTIEEYAVKHNVCPHEFALDITLWTDIVICDYNYAFDPTASLKRFFSDEPSGRFVFLIDEAHNLVDRSREMFSAEIHKNEFYGLRKEFKTKDKWLYKTLGKINTYISESAKKIEDGKKTYITPQAPEDLNHLLLDFVEKSDKWLAQESQDGEFYKKFLDLYFKSLDFLRTSEFFDERYVFYTEKGRNGVYVKLMCLDPSFLLSQVLEKACGGIFFSATLAPLPYFRDVLGGKPDDFAARLPSPFEKGNCCVIVEGGISTRYKDRENSYLRIADALHIMIKSKKGNYLAFFSSYDYMTRVYEAFTDKFPDEEVLFQRQYMNEDEREEFLAEFSCGGNGFIAFAVLGGIFSEGIDLAGDRLIGVAVIGVGLPLISDERDSLLAYYDKNNEPGFDYAYMFPGMNKVLQAAGRVIRTADDRGVILLIDDRFLTGRYIGLFPEHFSHFKKTSYHESLGNILGRFWID